MMIEHKDSVLEDIKKVKAIIMVEKMRRFSNIEQEIAKRRSWNPKLSMFMDLFTAQQAIENIETYVNNCPTATPAQYEAFKVYIRKSDMLWKQNFNDYFVKYKYIDGQIVRNKS